MTRRANRAINDILSLKYFSIKHESYSKINVPLRETNICIDIYKSDNHFFRLSKFVYAKKILTFTSGFSHEYKRVSFMSYFTSRKLFNFNYALSFYKIHLNLVR
ncbi:hypothetical protein PUN28_019317 [Cardiocondyla obscurior]|uniref:Uncharacterized protein n=1 Tax=Cardiocondyla obscurior TaxID=286306 RepID=A0AAW2EF16_9HYME